MKTATTLLVCLALAACAVPGTVTTPTTTSAAQDVGRDQGTASATESGSASARVIPIVINLVGVRKATITTGEDGSTTTELEGADDGEVAISGGVGFVTMTETHQEASTSSGGGAAGGVGGAERGANTATATGGQ